VDTIGFIGSGNMAEALIKGITAAKLYAPENVFISDIRTERLEFLKDMYGVTAVENNTELTEKVETLVLSIKPQNMNDALDSIKDAINAETLIISIAAGIKMANMIEQGKTPFIAPQRLEEIGYKIAAYPLTLLNAGVFAMQQALAALKNGSQAEGLLDFSVLQEIVGFNDYYEVEKRYGHNADHPSDEPR